MPAVQIDISSLKEELKARSQRDRENKRAQRVALGRRLVAVRKAVGLTQIQVVERCSMTQPKLSDVEAGKGPLSAAQKECLAEVYGVTVAELVELPLAQVLNRLQLTGARG